MELAVTFSEIGVRILNADSLVRAVLSGRRRNYQLDVERIEIRPVLIKDSVLLQVMSNDGLRTTTKNYAPTELNIIELLNSGFANFLVESVDSIYSVRITKKDRPLIHEERVAKQQELNHDRVKLRLLPASDPYLIEIGISDLQGKVKPSRQDKFLQVEEFLRLLSPTLTAAISAGQIHKVSESNPIRIVDLGCGHAYLTFAAHQYLASQALPVHVLGIDVREESRERNTAIARKLGIEKSIEFRAEEIAQTKATEVDVAIALHACDTATDDALAWAVKNGAPLILAAPCCHHDLQTQMKAIPEPWALVTRQGLLKERLGDILTDAIRVQILKILGYRVETVEFIGGEHTPRNLMIRAVKTGAQPESSEIAKYQQLISEWGFSPALAIRLAAELELAGV
ncbi:MAG: SAM-dependent methyltransferase [Actinomycetes bacterium]